MAGLPRIVVASGNRKKAREIVELLSLGPSSPALGNGDVSTLADFPDAPPIAETGDSFVENAMLKAGGISSFLRDRRKLRGVLVVADDSGLEVPALANRPGIWSARFALRAVEEGLVGPEFRERYAANPDEANIDALLLLLEGRSEAERTARFISEVVLALDGDVLCVFHGACEGRIAPGRAGGHGFGYDPVFFYPPFGQTFGQVAPARKHTISHRRAALEGARPALLQLLAGVAPKRLSPAPL
ncbi:non-canonical purine NTP pyrophosphatase [bacterium]|nr:non-canonical purine NTP pyrophosphatase [bacterium]